MKLELTIPEIEQFIQSYFDVSVGIKYLDIDRIKVNYIFNMEVTVQDVQDYCVLFGYKVNKLTHVIARGTKFFMKEKFNSDIVVWDTSKKEILLNLNQITGLKGFLKVYRIQSFEIRDEKIILTMVI